ncbi:hypothetical protein HDU93_002266 [Gonapodya sp. JEL0774]|nr:hypothetical protein HDU93_002266 [Gonapodya sp. JEL0774]
MQARAGIFKAVDSAVGENLLDGVAAVLDVIAKVTSVPVFGACAEALRAVYTVAKDFKDNKELVVRLASRCALLVKAMADRMEVGGKKLSPPLRVHAVEFTAFLKEIADYLELVKGKPKWFRIINSSRTRKELEEYGNRLQGVVTDFQLAVVLDIEKWRGENDNDLRVVESASQEVLEQVVNNDATVLATLELEMPQVPEVQRTIQATLRVGAGTPRERDLLAKAHLSLVRISGHDLVEDPWHIPATEVVRDPRPFDSGGYGKVYFGTWSGTRRVAIKDLLVDHPDERLVALFRNEVKRWYGLHHPNILPLFGANLLAAPPFMVSPYIRNGNLISYLRSHPRADRVELMFDIACAMQYLHSRGILHCDLKGFNVLVDDLGNALVMDFGFATVSTRVSILSKVKRPGTLRWWAPEIFGMIPNVSEQTDVYAFAMTVYEMYTLQVPYCAVYDDVLVQVHVKHGTRPDIDEYTDVPVDERPSTTQMPDSVKALVRRCWDASPNSRSTFSDIVAYLKQHFQHLNDPQSVRDARRIIKQTEDRLHEEYAAKHREAEAHWKAKYEAERREQERKSEAERLSTELRIREEMRAQYEAAERARQAEAEQTVKSRQLPPAAETIDVKPQPGPLQVLNPQHRNDSTYVSGTREETVWTEARSAKTPPISTSAPLRPTNPEIFALPPNDTTRIIYFNAQDGNADAQNEIGCCYYVDWAWQRTWRKRRTGTADLQTRGTSTDRTIWAGASRTAGVWQWTWRKRRSGTGDLRTRGTQMRSDG